MIGRLVAGAAGLGAACFAYGVLIEQQAFRLRRIEVPVLAPGSAPIRVLHISDLHLMPGQLRKLAFVRGLADERPDLVVNTGDNLSSADAIDELMDALESLPKVPRVFVFGSNDHVGPRPINPLHYFVPPSTGPKVRTPMPADELRRRLTDAGWTDAEHRRVVLDVAGRRVEIRGTADAHMGAADYATVAGAADPDVDLALGVTHAPYRALLDSMTTDGVDLLMAGHTHGGQVCIPGYGALVTNCDIEPARVKGLSSHSAAGRTAALHVSAGLGTSPFAPYRFACPPEASLLTLVARESDPSAQRA